MTDKEFKKFLSYNPDTGEFRWAANSSRNVRKGDIAGSLNRLGYRRITFQGEHWYAHRLAWLYTYGIWPIGEIDHINGKPDDNRISNLRAASRSENLANSRRYNSNTSGYKGVYLSKRKGRTSRWKAQIKVNQRQIHIGHFDTAEEAHKAYRKAASLLFGEFARAS